MQKGYGFCTRCGRRALGADLALRQIGEKDRTDGDLKSLESWTFRFRDRQLDSIKGILSAHRCARTRAGAGLVFGHIGENDS